MEPRRNTETDGSSGRPVMSDEPNENSAKSVLTEVTRSNKGVLRGSIIGDEKNDATLKSEVFFNTTDGSSGRPVMSDKPNESSAKSVLTEVTRSNKRALRASEVFFNTTDGNTSGLRETSFPVPPASKKWKNKEWTNSEPGCYTFMEVIMMTDNFRKRIEEYGFGTVYHGKLQTGQEVAVKVWAARSYSAAKEFHEFEKVCGKYEKCCEHMVKVIGYCEEGDHQISIYEYMPGGTLQQHLHGKGVFDSKTHALDWKTRLQIALHIAQGLQHFPGMCFQLRSNDIFLTENWVPKIHMDPLHINSISVSGWGWAAINRFGYFLWGLISRQPQPIHGEGLNHLVKIVLEDSGNMGITNPTLGSNFRTETIMKIVQLTHVCRLCPQFGVPQLTMSDVIDEINGALQLEGKKQQQPETSNVQTCHGFSKPGLYTLMEVTMMTDNFEKTIEEYGFETMYHGKLQTGQEVAVKVWELRSHSAAKEFHQFGLVSCNSEKGCEHIVQMIGYYESETHQISIYEYMPGGVLQNRLFGSHPLAWKLDWKTRLKIALHIAQGLPYFLEQYIKLESKNIFLTKNGVPKVTFQPWSLNRENSLVYEFGRLLWELISGKQQHKPREGLNLVEDFHEGLIDPTLGSNFRAESIMKIIRIAHSCIQPMGAQPRMSDLINEMNGALQLEEGPNAEEGAMNIEIPQFDSESKTSASLATALKVMKWKTIFDEKFSSNCDRKGKRRQQPQTSTTQSHGSRSWEGDSLSSGSDDEVSSADTSASDYECRFIPQVSPGDKKHFNLLPMLPGDNDLHFEDLDGDLISEDRANMSYQCPDRGNIDEFFSVSLSPGPKFCDTFTSTEGVPDLPTHTRPIRVAGRKNNKGDVELLFEDVGNMLEVVGVGLEWAKVVVTKELGVEVRHIGEYAWKDLWANLKMPGQVYGGFELMNIICSELQILDQRPSNIVLEDLTERFGVGLTSTDVVSAYVEDHVEQSNDQEFFPYVLDIAKYMGLEGKNVVKSSSVSSGEVKSLKRTVGGSHSKEKSGGNKDPPQDPSEDPPLDPPQDLPPDPPQDPSETPPPDPPGDPSQNPPPDPPGDPSQNPPPDPPGDPSQNPPPDPPGDPSQNPPPDPPGDPSQNPSPDPPGDPPNPLPPSEMEGRKVLVVIIYPELGYLHEGPHGQVVREGHPLHKASIAPVLEFEFQVNGKDKKITTTLRTECNLGEDGGPHLNPPDLGYFQDDITISLTCEIDRAALLSSARVENIVDVRRTITNIKSSSSTRECSGQIGVAGPLLNLIGVQGEGSYGGTKEKSDSSAIEISTKQLSSFHVGQKKIPGSLVFNFVYPEEVEGRIADAHHGPRELITLGIGETFESTIIGEWDNFYQDPLDPTCRKCPYSFKIKRHITSIGGLRQSRGIGQEPQCIRQWYKVPLWVNHAMTHILHRHKVTKLEAPGVKRLEHVIEANPASYSG